MKLKLTFLVKFILTLTKLKTLISEIIKKASKNKEPIRPNRLFERWDVYINKPPTLKYRVDGKRNPKVRKMKKGFLRINH